jgi:hypothetical protein
MGSGGRQYGELSRCGPVRGALWLAAIHSRSLTTAKSITGPQPRPATWPRTFKGWPYTVPAPGYTANWILERPSTTTAGSPVPLAQFGSVYYDGCWASTGGPEGGLDAGPGDLLSMQDSSGTSIAETVTLNPALTGLAFRIDYVAPEIGVWDSARHDQIGSRWRASIGQPAGAQHLRQVSSPDRHPATQPTPMTAARHRAGVSAPSRCLTAPWRTAGGRRVPAGRRPLLVGAACNIATG